MGVGLAEQFIFCGSCGEREVDGYVAMARSCAPAVRLQCVDCLVRAAHAAGVVPDAEKVARFVDGHVMGSVEACFTLREQSKVV